MGGIQALATIGGKRASALPELVFQGPQNQGERRTELVADVREEGSLGPINLRQRFRPLTLVFVGPPDGDGGGHAGCDQIVESAVSVVER